MNQREIKFRAWEDDTKQMLIWEDMKAMSLKSFTTLSYLHPMQFTGLKDKNGKEIYEGDVYCLRTVFDIHDLSKDYTWTGSRVLESLQDFFEEKGYAEHEMGENWEAKNIKVIGNIYENPELLTNPL